MPKISVIIPVYNAEKYIKECVDSVLNQDFQDYEIIVVNDGSTDNTAQILKEYDTKIIFINQPNSGSSATRNRGVQNAEGEYILHIDSDDFIEHNYLSLMYESAVKFDADVVVCDFYKFINGEDIYIQDYKKIDGLVDHSDYMFHLIRTKKTHHNVFNKLIKRDLALEFSYPNGIFLGEDLFAIFKIMSSAKRIAKLNQSFYHYRIGDNNTSQFDSLRGMMDHKFVYEALIKFVKERNFESEDIKFLEYRMIKGTYLPVLLCRVDFFNENYKKALQIVKDNAGNIINLDGFSLLRFKQKILFKTIRRIKNSENLGMFLTFYNKINTFFSGKKTQNFK